MSNVLQEMVEEKEKAQEVLKNLLKHLITYNQYKDSSDKDKELEAEYDDSFRNMVLQYKKHLERVIELSPEKLELENYNLTLLKTSLDVKQQLAFFENLQNVTGYLGRQGTLYKNRGNDFAGSLLLLQKVSQVITSSSANKQKPVQKSSPLDLLYSNQGKANFLVYLPPKSSITSDTSAFFNSDFQPYEMNFVDIEKHKPRIYGEILMEEEKRAMEYENKYAAAILLVQFDPDPDLQEAFDKMQQLTMYVSQVKQQYVEKATLFVCIDQESHDLLKNEQNYKKLCEEIIVKPFDSALFASGIAEENKQIEFFNQIHEEYQKIQDQIRLEKRELLTENQHKAKLSKYKGKFKDVISELQSEITPQSELFSLGKKRSYYDQTFHTILSGLSNMLDQEFLSCQNLYDKVTDKLQKINTSLAGDKDNAVLAITGKLNPIYDILGDLVNESEVKKYEPSDRSPSLS